MSDTGQSGYVAIGRQTAKGAAAVPTQGIYVNDYSVSGQTELVVPDPEIGGGRAIVTSGVSAGSFKVSGDLSALLRSKMVGFLLMGAGFAAPAPTQEATTGAYTHAFVPGAMTYLTLERSWGANRLISRAQDCLVDELTFSVDAEGQATVEASFIGTTEARQASAGTPTFETDPVADWKGSALTLDSLSTYRAMSMSLAIRNNLTDDEFVIGSRFLDDVTPKRREIDFEVGIKLGNDTPAVTELYRAAVWGSKTATSPQALDPFKCAADVTFGSSKLIGTSVVNRFGLTATLTDVILEGFPLEMSGDDVLEASVKGIVTQGAGQHATINLRNAFATAYSAA